MLVKLQTEEVQEILANYIMSKFVLSREGTISITINTAGEAEINIPLEGDNEDLG